MCTMYRAIKNAAFATLLSRNEMHEFVDESIVYEENHEIFTEMITEFVIDWRLHLLHRLGHIFVLKKIQSQGINDNHVIVKKHSTIVYHQLKAFFLTPDGLSNVFWPAILNFKWIKQTNTHTKENTIPNLQIGICKH